MIKFANKYLNEDYSELVEVINKKLPKEMANKAYYIKAPTTYFNYPELSYTTFDIVDDDFNVLATFKMLGTEYYGQSIILIKNRKKEVLWLWMNVREDIDNI